MDYSKGGLEYWFDRKKSPADSETGGMDPPWRIDPSFTCIELLTGEWPHKPLSTMINPLVGDEPLIEPPLPIMNANSLLIKALQ